MTNRISAAVVSRQAHMTLVAALVVKGDVSAIALLSSPAAMATDYVGFAQRQAKNHRLALCDILEALDGSELESLRKELPKDCPKRVEFLDALKTIRSSAPVAWSIAPTGSILVGSKANQVPSKCTLITGSFPNSDGSKPTDHQKGLKFWRVIAGMSQADRDSLTSMIADADRQGWK